MQAYEENMNDREQQVKSNLHYKIIKAKPLNNSEASQGC